MKFWNCGPTTIWHNKECVAFYFSKSLHPMTKAEPPIMAAPAPEFRGPRIDFDCGSITKLDRLRLQVKMAAPGGSGSRHSKFTFLYSEKVNY